MCLDNFFGDCKSKTRTSFFPRTGLIHTVETFEYTVDFVARYTHAVVLDADGHVAGSVQLVSDITVSKRAEEGRQLLVRELNHRVKNTLATVQSIAMQTQRNAKTPAAFSEDLTARIAAQERSVSVKGLARIRTSSGRSPISSASA